MSASEEEVNAEEFDCLLGSLMAIRNDPTEKLGAVEQTVINDAFDELMKMRRAITDALNVVDNMGVLRQELCEESIKDLDRRLMEMRSRVSGAASLEEKLALMKDQRQMEHLRAERRKRLFALMDDGAIYAHEPLPRDELVALLAPMRELMMANP